MTIDDLLREMTIPPSLSIHNKVERNEEIVRLYTAGHVPQYLGDLYGISKERVRQILRQAGVALRRSGNPGEDPPRSVFLGVGVTDEVKTALREEAKRRGISMSSLTAVALQEMLGQVTKETE
jgi:acyl CoA:acetate/3-ketoacid CoA transferase